MNDGCEELIRMFCFSFRAEQIASVAPSLDQIIKAKTPSFKRKLRSKFGEKRSRSVSSIHQLKEDSLFGNSSRQLINKENSPSSLFLPDISSESSLLEA